MSEETKKDSLDPFSCITYFCIGAFSMNYLEIGDLIGASLGFILLLLGVVLFLLNHLIVILKRKLGRQNEN